MYKSFCQIGLLLSIFISTAISRDFKVFWNLPTFMCRHYHIQVLNLTQQYGIIQNENDDFRGNHIAILYDPGNFPAILKNSTTKNYFYRNHGVPQEGDLYGHLKHFENDVNKLIPNKDFSGLVVIDFESWRPIFRQNFGVLKPYKDLSTFIERQRHPFWNEHRIDVESARRFEKSAQEFLLETIWHGKKLRPKARWGYYAFPYCFNGRGNNVESCPNYVKKENNGIQWLFDESDVIFPSVYLNENIEQVNRVSVVKGRVKEAIRMAKNVNKALKPSVFVYHRYVFADSLKYLSEIDEYEILNAIKTTGADGVILWGSSNDLNSREKCETFYNYLKDTLGPVVHSLHPKISVETLINSSKK